MPPGLCYYFNSWHREFWNNDMAYSQAYIDKWVRYLKDVDRDMSRIAAQKLGATGDPSVVPHLADTLRNRPDDVRSAAILALGEIGDAAAVPALVEVLDDSSPHLASAAAEALGRIGDASAVKPLIKVVSHYKQQNHHDQLRGFYRGLYLAAIAALERIGTPEAKRAVKQYYTH